MTSSENMKILEKKEKKKQEEAEEKRKRKIAAEEKRKERERIKTDKDKKKGSHILYVLRLKQILQLFKKKAFLNG